MLGNIPTFLKIPRSVNIFGSKAKSEKSNQSIPKGLTIFKGECIFYLSEVDSSI